MRQDHSGTCFDTLVHTSIVAFEVFSRGIGSYPDTKLPWNVEEDMRIFESYFFNPGYFPICGYNTYHGRAVKLCRSRRGYKARIAKQF